MTDLLAALEQAAQTYGSAVCPWGLDGQECGHAHCREVRAEVALLRELAQRITDYRDAIAVLNADTDAVSDDDYARAIRVAREAEYRLLVTVTGGGK